MPRTSTRQLANAQRRYRALTTQLADIGLIKAGSLTRRYTHCANPGCHCHADPPQPHGPYWQWTTKIDGKTITRRLTDAQAQLYQDWINNDRKLRALIDQMRTTAAEATELIMHQTEQPPTEV